MPHDVDGFKLAFTSRRSWKAKVHLHNKLLGIVPVTWNTVYQFREKLIEVWYQDVEELEARRASREPFAFALAVPGNPGEHPAVFSHFVAVMEGVATGQPRDFNSLEAQVLGRLNSRKLGCLADA